MYCVIAAYVLIFINNLCVCADLHSLNLIFGFYFNGTFLPIFTRRAR